MSTDENLDSSQNRFRVRVVEEWGIPEGSCVLEIGCGQGDTTEVLMDAVGSEGHVLAVDLAEGSYGSPVTIGDAMLGLKNGPLGDRLDYHLEFDVLDPANTFPPDSFDIIILAHCTWYFNSLDKLKDTLLHIRPYTYRLCLSEWDLDLNSMDHAAHLLAVLIQGQAEAFKTESASNVRTPYSKETLQTLLKETGWKITKQEQIEAPGLQDSQWEILACLIQTRHEIKELPIPPKLRALIDSQIDILQRLADRGPTRALPSYIITAERL